MGFFPSLFAKTEVKLLLDTPMPESWGFSSGVDGGWSRELHWQCPPQPLVSKKVWQFPFRYQLNWELIYSKIGSTSNNNNDNNNNNNNDDDDDDDDDDNNNNNNNNNNNIELVRHVVLFAIHVLVCLKIRGGGHLYPISTKKYIILLDQNTKTHKTNTALHRPWKSSQPNKVAGLKDDPYKGFTILPMGKPFGQLGLPR